MENQGEGCRRPLRPFLASLLLRLLPPLSSPSPDAHPSPARNIAKGEGRTVTPSASGRCYRHNVATPRRRSTNNQQQGSASTVCHHASLVLFPVPLFCLLPSPSTPSPVLPFRLRLRFLLFFALISSARSHLFALPSSCSSVLAILPSY